MNAIIINGNDEGIYFDDSIARDCIVKIPQCKDLQLIRVKNTSLAIDLSNLDSVVAAQINSEMVRWVNPNASENSKIPRIEFLIVEYRNYNCKKTELENNLIEDVKEFGCKVDFVTAIWNNRNDGSETCINTTKKTQDFTVLAKNEFWQKLQQRWQQNEAYSQWKEFVCE